MDIVAKKSIPDPDGVRIAELDEEDYRALLWSHRPLTDFWQVGPGTARRLMAHGMRTMGDIAAVSQSNEELLYRLFGVNAELLIDHAWGYEPCTIADIKAYKPTANSLGSGQVLHQPYPFEKARLIARKMTDLLVLDLVDKGLVTDQIVLTVGYDRENLENPEIRSSYHGAITTDPYGRPIPKHAHGTANLHRRTSSTRLITEAVMELFDRVVDPMLLVRRVNLTATHVLPESEAGSGAMVQLDLFADTTQEDDDLEREKRRQKAVISIQKKYGKNAILKGMNYLDGATTKDRNSQIGGHKA
jgi:DNA polymerase V